MKDAAVWIAQALEVMIVLSSPRRHPSILSQPISAALPSASGTEDCDLRGADIATLLLCGEIGRHRQSEIIRVLGEPDQRAGI
jgi:hypothetical protein